MALLDPHEQECAQVVDLSQAIAQRPVGALTHYFLDPEQRSGCRLFPDLLFRHAASQLYQEAHLEIERDPQGFLPGMAPADTPKGRLARDVRYTPPNLARALVQQALLAMDVSSTQPASLRVLDPACGSGVFHRECLRELTDRGVSGAVRFIGYDISPIAAYVAKFSMEQAQADLTARKLNVDVEIVHDDALGREWPRADLVLMNPPFVPWQSLGGEQRERLRACLGPLFRIRPDLAMGFLLKAVECLLPGGVLASVVPTPLLATRSAGKLRERLLEMADLVFIGRFEGYSYFPDSLVEPAFIVLRKKSPAAPSQEFVKILVAQETAEDASLRLLRTADAGEPREDSRIDIFSAHSEAFEGGTWLPQRKAVHRLRELVSRIEVPRISNVFNVRMGVRTGKKAAFVLPAARFAELEENEKRYFRPMAGQRTLRNGVLEPLYYLFYPYGPDGMLLESEEQLAAEVPTFYEQVLLPHKTELAQRRRVTYWWELAEKRRWQLSMRSKLVSTYFGSSGSFAYDETGEYVVVQGFAWLWKAESVQSRVKDVPGYFAGTKVPWAYLALLNSRLFERILSTSCPRVQGGQFDLSKRHVGRLPIPNLGSADFALPDLVRLLAELGRRIHAGELAEVTDEVDRAVAQAYGLTEADYESLAK